MSAKNRKQYFKDFAESAWIPTSSVDFLQSPCKVRGGIFHTAAWTFCVLLWTPRTQSGLRAESAQTPWTPHVFVVDFVRTESLRTIGVLLRTPSRLRADSTQTLRTPRGLCTDYVDSTLQVDSTDSAWTP